MTPFDDDRDDMDLLRGTTALSDSDVEALLAGRARPGWEDVHGSVRMLRTAPTPPAPAPSAALLAVMDAGFEPLPLLDPDGRSPRRRWTARLAVATAAVVATTFGAAAANALPGPVQNAVAVAVGAVTPLQLPRRDAGPVPGEDAGERETRDEGEGVDSSNDLPSQGDVAVPGDAAPDVEAPTTPGPPSAVDPATPAPAAGTPSARDSGKREERDADERDQRAPATKQPATSRDDEPDDDESDGDGSDSPEAEEPDETSPDLDEPAGDARDSLDVEGPEQAAGPDEGDSDDTDSDDSDDTDSDDTDGSPSDD